MFDVNNTTNHILINLYTMPEKEKRAFPVRLSNREFIRGVKAGAGEAAASEVTGIVYTDTEIVTMLTEFFEDPQKTPEALYYSIGALFGQIFYTAK